jgi:hypothetical protein
MIDRTVGALLDARQRKLDSGLSEAETLRSLKTIKKRVKLLCAEYPEVTGDYNVLIARYYFKYYSRGFGCSFKTLLSLPSSESVSRAFRKLVEQGQVLPSGKIKARRAHREAVMREGNAEW